MRTLFEPALSHRDDPLTSYKAADKMIKSGRLMKQEEDVSKAITHYYNRLNRIDFTAKELATWTKQSPIWNHLAYYTVQRRLSGLRNKGKIERISINNNGKPPWKKRDGCCVWKAI